MQPRRILLAPLDWGLGHASRCVPLIRKFLKAGDSVTLAGSGPSAALLREQFPELILLELPGYRIRYPSHGGLVPYLGLQLPEILRSIRREHEWMKELIRDQSFDLIVSDNRYGLWHPDVHSVLITHQLTLQLPAVLKWAKGLVQRRMDRWMEHFNEIWVPDHAGNDNLSGLLSHPPAVASHVKYIGPLSRFSAYRKEGSIKKQWDAVALLSGPEPQRSLLEALLVKRLRLSGQKARLITGQPGQPRHHSSDGSIEFVNHLNDADLAQTLLTAGTIYCRSGYSSLMDLDALGLKAILIPTPGQTEQEYLAAHFREKGWQVMKQSEL